MEHLNKFHLQIFLKIQSSYVEFPEDQMQKMAESIKERGVKTPISVKPHPTEQGKWLINYGARRFRASIMAGKDTIPAFVDNDHDDWIR